MDKNKTEKDNLYQWACDHFTEDSMYSIFTPIQKDSVSYYETVQNKEYIKEYEPETVADIRQELLSLWGNADKNDEVFDKVKTICTVACMKNKKLGVPDESIRKESNTKQIKPFIYQL